MRLLLLTIAVFLSTPALAQLDPEEAATLPLAEVRSALPGSHPSSYFLYADRLNRAGQREEAMTWLFVGRIRYLLHLNANPADPEGETEVFTAMNGIVFHPAMEWAGGDIDMLVARIDAALAWDMEHPNGYTPRDSFSEQWEHARSDVEAIRDAFDGQRDYIRAERERAGLSNR